MSTYFLTAFAMLYVINDNLPNTTFLTTIDKVCLQVVHSWDLVSAQLPCIINALKRFDLIAA